MHLATDFKWEVATSDSKCTCIYIWYAEARLSLGIARGKCDDLILLLSGTTERSVDRDAPE